MSTILFTNVRTEDLRSRLGPEAKRVSSIYEQRDPLRLHGGDRLVVTWAGTSVEDVLTILTRL